MRGPRALASLLALGAALAAAGPAAADCPLRAGREPPVGFLAATAAALMPPATPPERIPALAARLAADAGAQLDSAEPGAASPTFSGVAGVAAEGQAAAGGWRACAAGSLWWDAGESGTASAGVLVPFTLSGIALGGSIDHEREPALAARPERLRHRVSAVRGHVSLSFIDLPVADGGSTLRVQVMPLDLDTARDLPGPDSTEPLRLEVGFGTAMFRFVAETPVDRGSIDIFAVEVAWIETAAAPGMAAPPPEGVATLSPLRFTREVGPWDYAVDAGFLAHAGEVDCEEVSCARGAYDVSVGRRIDRVRVGGRAVRSGFAAWTGGVGIEDRIAGEVTAAGDLVSLRGEGFAARARLWTGGPSGVTAGLGAALTVPLGGGLAAAARAELARSYYARVDGAEPVIEPALRLGASLSWTGEYAR